MMFMDFRHLEQKEKWDSLSLYEEAFPEDRGEYAAYYYKWKCRDNEILVLTDCSVTEQGEQNDAICSMLHLNPYRIWISTDSMILHYIVAVATALPYRRRGCMRRLMLETFSWLYNREEPFTYLMPAETFYYEPFGFRVIYDQKPISFPKDIDEANNWAIENFDVVTLRDEAYIQFFNEEPEPVSITEETVSDDRIISERDPGSSDWKPQIMCRIIYLPRLLECLRADRPELLYLQVHDALIEENTGLYRWTVDRKHSHVTRIAQNPYLDSASDNIFQPEKTEENFIEIEIEDLAEQLFGVVPLHPVLSHIKVLSRICINEEV
ncbi:MAG: GNAT family N-acetyltransferase [Lachnospiraceae bacterium]